MRPFDSLRILDLTHVLAGPFCTYQFGLLGAQVIKIESPREPDMARGRGAAPALNAAGLGINYQVQGSNKRSLALDLAHAQGREVFLELVGTADVVVENYRKGALALLGLGADVLLQHNPALVICSITGFGQEGPWAETNAYDNVIQATSGMMTSTGGAAAPVKTGASVIDYASGMIAAFAISAALRQRDATGRGVVVDCSMLDAAFMMMAPELSAELYTGERQPMPREAGLGTYETSDGLLMLGAFNVRQNRRLWTLLDRREFAELDGWPALWAEAEAMRAALQNILVTRPASEWETMLNSAGVPARMVRAPAEALALEQVRARAPFTAVNAGETGDEAVSVPISPFRLSEGGGRIDRPAPALGQDSDAILTELGLTPAAIAQLRSVGAVA